jgi:hypothetical protein
LTDNRLIRTLLGIEDDVGHLLMRSAQRVSLKASSVMPGTAAMISEADALGFGNTAVDRVIGRAQLVSYNWACAAVAFLACDGNGGRV